MECQLRPWRAGDAGALARLLNNRRILDNLRDGLPFPYTERDGAEYIAAMLGADPDRTFAFAITFEDQVAGSIGAFRQENIHARTAEVGYYVGEPYWGKGLGTSAVRQLCEHVFRESDIIRMFAEPFDHNAASCRVLEKAGFQLEGVLRCNAVKNGKTVDMRMYSRIRPGFSGMSPDV